MGMAKIIFEGEGELRSPMLIGKTPNEWVSLILSGNLVEAVRCKDCEYGELDNVSRYRSIDGEMDEAGKYKCCYSWAINHWYDGEHFCADGKRRNNENS